MSRNVLIALAAGASFAGFLALQPGASAPGRTPASPGVSPQAAAHAANGNNQSGPSGSSVPLPPTHATASSHEREQATALLHRLPARFEKIDGATPDDVSFIARGYGRQLLLSCDRAVLAPGMGATPDVTMRVEGASPCVASGDRELPGRTNYLIGDDAPQWRTDVRSYERASFAQVYPGIDLVYYGTGDHLEYDFVVSPGVDPSAIALRFEGTDRVEIDTDGALVLHAGGGELRQHAPAVYQQIDGEQRRVEGRYVMRDATRVGFALGAYDRAEPLTIDPVLVYSSYLGGPANDTAADVALDAAGNIYVLGTTYSTVFPTMTPYQGGNGGVQDVFVIKLDRSGTHMLYATYFGGNAYDLAGSLAVDAAGNIFISGYSDSTNFPTAPGSYVYGTVSSQGMFVAKLTGEGASLGYVARIAAYDSGIIPPRLAVDAGGQAYVAGTTGVAGLPVLHAVQPQCAGVEPSAEYCSYDGYLFKLNATGSALMYATYIGGSAHDYVHAIAIDNAGAAYVVGDTLSTDFPVVNAFQPLRPGGLSRDGFLTVVSPSGSTFVNSSYLGGSNLDSANDIAVHADGSVVIVGRTWSSDFPELNPSQPAWSGNAFVTKLDARLTHLVFSTHLGADADSDEAVGVALDVNGGVYVGGVSSGCTFAAVRAYPVLPSSACGPDHPFVASFSASGALRHAMLIGGETHDNPTALALGTDKTIYLAGQSRSRTFPTLNAFQSANASPPGSPASSDAILMKFATALEVTGVNPGTISLAGGDTIDISGFNFLSGATVEFDDGRAVASTFVNPTLIRAIAPPHTRGLVSIGVNNPDGESFVLPNALRYSDCEFSLSLSDVTFSLNGGIGSVDVSTGEGACGWRAVSNVPWLHVTSAASGVGNGHVTYAADPFSQFTRRSGTLTIGRRTLTVIEDGFSRLVTGDFTGDGAADLATFRPSDGRWTLAGQPDVTLGIAGDIAVPADYDGNGIMDRAVYRPSTGEWIIQGIGTIQYGLPGDIPVPGRYLPFTPNIAVDLAVFRPSTGRWFIRDKPAVDFGHPGDLPVPADYDGDYRTEFAVFRPSTGEWFVSGTAGPVTWGMSGDIPVPADYNGDNRADIAVFRPSTGSWQVRGQFTRSYGLPGDVPMALDYDGDHRAEVAVYRPSSGLWFIDGRGAGVSIGTPGDVPAFFRLDRQLRAAPDLDRDRLADVVLSQGSTWKLVRSAGGRTISSLTFGLDTDRRQVADFDGDGRPDLVLFRPSNSAWYIALSTTGYTSYTSSPPDAFGNSTDTPVPADYDGDGRADRAVFRPGAGFWSITQSSTNTTVNINWGLNGDVPLAEDTDGDGRADLIVFRPSTGRWYVRRSIDGGMTVFDWGLPGDIAVPADYDGDGRTDIAVYRPSTVRWWILLSSGEYTTSATADFGIDGGIPVPADYDGDGRADVAVFSPSTGEFFMPAGLLFTSSPGDAVVKHQ